LRRKLPSTQALVCFEASARHESFTKAADELALTQSAVCRQVAGLEDFLGVKLFRRSRHGIVLTEAGIGYGRLVARRLDAIERDTLSVIGRGGASGTVDLAVVPTFATRWLLPRMPRFQVLHPEVVVNMETRTRPFLFAETDFDAALYAGTPSDLANWPGTQAIPLMPEIVVPVCSPKLLPPRRRLDPHQLGCCSSRPDPTPGGSGSRRRAWRGCAISTGLASNCSRWPRSRRPTAWESR